MQTYGRFDVALDHGIGATLYSPEGKAYIDFTSGIGVNSVGYGNRAWADAIYAQALKLGHISNLYYTEPYAKLAELLTARSGMSRVFFANAGGEANEGIIKLARKYSHDKYGESNPNRNVIVTLLQSFHGRTVTTLAATGQEHFHKHFFPFTEGFRHVPANDLAAVTAEIERGDVCAVFVELIQGEGGVLPLDPTYVKALRELCSARDVLLLADEVQTGIGRTGELFAFQKYGILPDAATFAKGIAGGLPMGGVLAAKSCDTTLAAGDHATTFGGNPIAAAAAVEVLRQLDDDALAKVTENGQYIRDTVASWGFANVVETRGAGLMIGVQVTGTPKDYVLQCIERGLLLLTAGSDALRILPPLTITRAEIDAGLAILKEVLANN
jgi:acetylornithine/N-succinyldiaminopimelate aminotransferase